MLKNYSEGILVYSPETKMDRLGKSDAVKSLEYDITALSNSDSISFTGTVYAARALQLDSMELKTDNETKKYAIERIYVEPKSKHWINRFRVYFSRAEFQKLSEMNNAPIFIIDNAVFRHSNKKWENERINFKNILEILTLNKKR